MRINPEIRYQDLALYVKDHLASLDASDTKLSLAVLVLTLYDLPLLLCLGYIEKMTFVWIALPFFLIIHLWLIRLLIKNVYSTQLETVLFLGCWGVLSFISLFISFIGLLYYFIEIRNHIFYLLLLLMTVGLAFILVVHQMKKFQKDPTIEGRPDNRYTYMGTVAGVPGVAYLFTVVNDRLDIIDGDLIMIFVVYFFIGVSAYSAAKFMHRYIYMRINRDYVKYQPIEAKRRRKLAKQGVVIK